MIDYSRHDFYHFFDKNLNRRRFYLKVQGSFIEVDKAVYYICYNSYRKQLEDYRMDYKNGLLSYDKLLDDGNSVLDTLGKDYDFLEEMYKQDVLKTVMNLINALDEEDKNLIIDLMIKGKKEREVAQEKQITQQMVSKRKTKIVKKLRKKLKNGCEKIKSLLF